MTEKKKKTKKKETDEERIAKARKRRLALAIDKTPVEEKSDDRDDFRKYFLKLQKNLKLEAYLEEVIWAHLKSTKHDKKDLFKEGIKHFGYKV